MNTCTIAGVLFIGHNKLVKYDICETSSIVTMMQETRNFIRFEFG